MPGPDPQSLEQRVARLERLVERLVARAASGGASTEVPPERPPTEQPGRGDHTWSWQREPDASTEVPPAGATHATEAKADLADHGERWLGRVGVIFMVLAFGFLFRYALDQGWIGPVFRLVLGFGAATAMLVIGLRLEGERERYSQYLLGGAIGIYYLVGFSAYELYSLVPFVVAFAFMCAVTVLAFVLAERQRLSSLAVIGAGGGLATPFLVNTGSGNVPGLIAYTMLILVGAGALQFLRGWRRLLLVLGFGGFAVMAFAVEATTGPGVVEGLATVAGIATAWALFGVFPLFRAHLHRLDPSQWIDPPLPAWIAKVASEGRVGLLLLRIGCVMGAFFAVFELGWLFTLERPTYGVLFGGAFLLYLALCRVLFDTRLALNASAETAAILLVAAIWLFLFDYRVMLPLAVAAAGMHTAHQRWGLPGVSLLGHVVFAQLMLFLIGRLDGLGIANTSPFGPEEVGALGAIALAFTSSFVLESELAKRVYRVGAHVAFMAWLATQFAPLARGQELISLSWGVYGIALLLLSLRLRHRGVQLAGLATLGVVAAKLLLVDMAQVDLLWRILLFMGFGAAFLGLSYLINRQAETRG